MPDDFPKAPDSAEPAALGFEPFQTMVRWFTPSELARTGAEAVISSLFGAYADNRELQAVRGKAGTFDYSVEPPRIDVGEEVAHETDTDGSSPGAPPFKRAEVDELWFDYVADLGDGWHPTYAVASLLAEPTLEVGGAQTQRGRLLVLGGDQVYPTAKREEYQNRFAGPYRAALPYVVDTPPHLFALPGNHDWYDGLTSFTRLFCQHRWIGGWKTQQKRSYFALELPHNWWLWGVDIQLNADIDQPQWDYFHNLGRELKGKHPEGVNIILCLAEPIWNSAGTEDDMASYESLAWFEQMAITDHGHRHIVGLAGDLHAYARWEHEDGRQRFISGGGGAYLYPTHHFPDTLRLPTEPGPKLDRQTETFTLGQPPDETGTPSAALYPPAAKSQALAAGALRFPRRNIGFSLFFGAFYAFLAWLVQSASKALDSSTENSFFAILADAGGNGVPFLDLLGELFVDLGGVLAHAPLAFLTALVLLVGLAAFADGTTWYWKAALGLWHTALHVGAFLLLTWLFVWVNMNRILPEGTSVDDWRQIVLYGAEMLLIGSVLAGMIWGFYLFVSDLFGRHANEVFSCQSNPDYKHILRCHIDREGTLTIYPIGIDKVPRGWDYNPGADGTPWFTPKGESIRARAHLIEPPIRVRPGARSAPDPAPVSRGAPASE